ncbi:MAG: hypothetical protein DHS20C02_00240 [Micavibrio sp.]|nr:MAG: hypothetical protein DHS20C02_00240 [Micavibrio sp.]
MNDIKTQTKEKQKHNFVDFIRRWNRERMNMPTPEIHLKMASWLEGNWRAGRVRMLLMAFRSSGKSTITGLFAAWLLYINPALRILVLAADFALAKKMVRNVRGILEAHPLTAHLKPKKAEQWSGDRFTVQREIELRDPSMLARGITSNITGSHADIIICDDVEVPGTCDSAEKREALRERLMETDYVLTAEGTKLFIGTPHNYHTIYGDAPRVELGEDDVFLPDFERLVIPVHDEDGVSAWPERFDLETIDRIKRSTGPNKFSSQMLLRPVNIAEGRLDPAALQFYDSRLNYIKELNQLEIEGRKMVSAHGYWDPAFGRGGDNSVFAAVFTDEDGESWLHKLLYIELDNHSDEDEAAQQCQQVAFQAQILKLPSVAVEDNGIGKMLPGILRSALAKNNVPCSVKSVHNNRAKDLRILEAFDVVLASRSLHVHESVRDTPFLSEMMEWKPGKKRCKDDGLDAVAGALALEPMRAKSFPRRGQHTWQDTGKQHKAKTDFNV